MNGLKCLKQKETERLTKSFKERQLDRLDYLRFEMKSQNENKMKRRISKMKKLGYILLVFILLLSFAACSSDITNEDYSSPTRQSGAQNSASDENSDNPNNSSAPTEEAGGPDNSSEAGEINSKSLVVYFPGRAIQRMLRNPFSARRAPIFLKSCPPCHTATTMILSWIWRGRNREITPVPLFRAA